MSVCADFTSAPRAGTEGAQVSGREKTREPLHLLASALFFEWQSQ